MSTVTVAMEDRLLLLSADNLVSLRVLAQAYQRLLADHHRLPGTLLDICFTASVSQSPKNFRLAVVGKSATELAENLTAFLQGEISSAVATGNKNPAGLPKLVFVFPGQGPQWWAMGRELLTQQPIFFDTIKQCDELIRKQAGWSLLTELTASENESRIDTTFEISQPTLVAFQIALVELWRSWGIVPDAVIGHSMGEVSAAYTAGILSLADAIKVILHQGRLLQRTAGQGKMAAVEMPVRELEQLLVGYQDRLSIAAINSPMATVLSGEAAALEEFTSKLPQKGCRCHSLHTTGVAGHSIQMQPLKAELTCILQGLQPRSAAIPIVSTVTGEFANGEEFNAEYWGRNIREPVNFATAIDKLAHTNAQIFLELSPHPVLALPISQCLRTHQQEPILLASLQRGEAEQKVILGSLGTLFTLGFNIDWTRLYPNGGELISLPLDALKDIEIDKQIESKPEFRRHLEAALPTQRYTMLFNHIQDQVTKVLRLSRADMLEATRSFFEMGMSSLKS
ncbi:MAG: acyltransferase domain-containing protein, partial [Acidobacteriota bacterium]